MAEAALPLDDYSFIDHLWRDWSPGYDGAWDVARVKESIGDPERMVAAISYYRAMWDPTLQVPELADEQAAALLPTPKPTLYLHGRDDDCMLLSSMGSPLDFMAEGSDVEVVDDAGHFLHVERPDVVNRRIIDFLTADVVARSACPGVRASAQPEDGVLPAGPAGEPLGHQRRRHPLGPCRIVGPPARRRQRARRDRPVAQRIEQPPPALAVRPGERCSAAVRRRARLATGRVRSPSARGARRTGGAAGTARSRGAPRCTRWRRGRTWPG